MQLRVFDESTSDFFHNLFKIIEKRTQYKFKENEGLQFAFDIEGDKPEEVVHQVRVVVVHCNFR